MKYDVRRTTKFKKDFKKAIKRGCEIGRFKVVVNMLQNGDTLPPKYKDHQLTGNWEGYRECHITPNWLLVYRVEEDKLVLVLTRTGSHSDLDLD